MCYVDSILRQVIQIKFYSLDVADIRTGSQRKYIVIELFTCVKEHKYESCNKKLLLRSVHYISGISIYHSGIFFQSGQWLLEGTVENFIILQVKILSSQLQILKSELKWSKL